MEITKIFAIFINPHIQVKFFCAILFNIFWVWDTVGCEDCQMSLLLYEMVVFKSLQAFLSKMSDNND